MSFLQRLGVTLPIVQAPMAGVSTPELAAAVSNAGGLGSMSLVVVTWALPSRALSVPFVQLASRWTVVANLLAGSLVGAWMGASWATRLRSETLYNVIAVLLVVIAAVLFLGHDPQRAGPLVIRTAQVIAGTVAGLAIGIVASLLGVAERTEAALAIPKGA